MTKSQHRSALDDWEKVLDPERLKANLERVSVFLTCYELLRIVIIDNPRNFFDLGTIADQSNTGQYRTEVLALHPRDQFHASCLWFRKMEALDDEDMGFISAIRKHRNDLAHEIPKYLMDSSYEVDIQLLDIAFFLVAKIERWWIREIEAGINPELDHIDFEDIPDRDIRGGTTFAMELILKIVYGQEEDLRRLLNVVQNYHA